MHVHVVQKTHTGMQSMPNLGRSWGMPPGNFVNLHFLRLNLRAFLMIYITLRIKSQNNRFYTILSQTKTAWL